MKEDDDQPRHRCGRRAAAREHRGAVLTQLRSDIETVLNQFKADLDGVKTFLLDEHDGAKTKIDDVFGTLDQLGVGTVNLVRQMRGGG